MEKGFWLQAMDDGTSVCVTVCMLYMNTFVSFSQGLFMCLHVLTCSYAYINIFVCHSLTHIS